MAVLLADIAFAVTAVLLVSLFLIKFPGVREAIDRLLSKDEL